MEIRTAHNRELRWIKKAYLEAFPKSERKPFGLMKQKVRQGMMEFIAASDSGHPVGFAVTARYKDMVLLDYFAIHRAYRGCRFGSEAFQLLKERYKDQRLILEIELPDENAPNREERIRRKQFYLKNGMQETGLKVCVFQVPMEVLTDGKPVTYEEYYEIYRETIGSVFAGKVTRL